MTRSKIGMLPAALFVLAAWAFVPAAVHAERTHGSGVQSRVPVQDLADQDAISFTEWQPPPDDPSPEPTTDQEQAADDSEQMDMDSSDAEGQAPTANEGEEAEPEPTAATEAPPPPQPPTAPAPSSAGPAAPTWAAVRAEFVNLDKYAREMAEYAASTKWAPLAAAVKLAATRFNACVSPFLQAAADKAHMASLLTAVQPARNAFHVAMEQASAAFSRAPQGTVPAAEPPYADALNALDRAIATGTRAMESP